MYNNSFLTVFYPHIVNLGILQGVKWDIMITIVQQLADTLALVIDVSVNVTVFGTSVTSKLDAVFLKVR